MNFRTDTPLELVAMLKRDEGFRPRVYIDSEGMNTIGIGFCLDRTTLPEIVAEFWCAHILDNIENRMIKSRSVGQTYILLNEPRQFAIKNMCYQMGVTGVCEFFNMWAALDIEDYQGASDHALDSLWAHQTQKRAQRIAKILRTGHL